MKPKDVCTKIGSGATPRGGKESYKTEGVPLIRSQNILDWSFTADGLAFIDDAQAESLDNVEVQPGDVLLNITGDSVARACKVPTELTPARVNQHVAIVRASSHVMKGTLLLLSYSIGLGVPFFIAAMFLERIKGSLNFIKAHLDKINIISCFLITNFSHHNNVRVLA